MMRAGQPPRYNPPVFPRQFQENYRLAKAKFWRRVYAREDFFIKIPSQGIEFIFRDIFEELVNLFKRSAWKGYHTLYDRGFCNSKVIKARFEKRSHFFSDLSRETNSV